MNNKSCAVTFLSLFVALFLNSCAHTSIIGVSPEEQAYIDRTKDEPLEFDVSKEKITEAWSRAESFIAKYKMTYLQPKGDYLIETQFVGNVMNTIAYKVIKTPLENGYRITIECPGGILVGPDAELNCQILSHYMRTGELPYPRLIKVK